MITPFMAALPMALLKALVASPAGRDAEIGSALGMPFVGG